MSIETLNKPELIKEVRRLTQELKIKESEIADLTKVSKEAEKAVESANIDSQSEVNSLPYVAISIIKKNKSHHRVMQVRFDLNGNAKVDFSKEKVEKEGYRAGYEAAKLMETVVAKQQEPEAVVQAKEVTNEN